MEVILIRHAKAGDRDPNTWPNDDKRPLTPQGVEEQHEATKVMMRMGIKFDFLVSSPILRAKQTADRKSTRLNSSHIQKSRMPSSA